MMEWANALTGCQSVVDSGIPDPYLHSCEGRLISGIIFIEIGVLLAVVIREIRRHEAKLKVWEWGHAL